MPEYISREAVNYLIEDMQNNRFILMCEIFNLALLKSKVAEIPAEDIQPVKRGKWEGVDYDTFFKCSECGHMTDWQRYKYCPYCGARMDGDT